MAKKKSKKKTGKKKVKGDSKAVGPIRQLEVEYVPVSKLKEWKDNPRVNDEAADRMVEVLGEHGFINPIIATRDFVIRAGNTRFKAAKKMGLKEVPVIFIDFESEEEATMYALADNKASEWADWDHSKLAKLFKGRSKVDMAKLERASGFKTTEIEWQGAAPIDLDTIDVGDDFSVPQQEFAIRIGDVKAGDLDTVLELVRIALEETGYKAKAF